MKNFLSLIARTFIAITAFSCINLHSIMQPKGPHRNLVWAKNWCWMDAALQCLAANDVLVAKLSKEQNNFPANQWVKELCNVLTAIRDTSKKEKVNPEQFYKLIPKEMLAAITNNGPATVGDSRVFIDQVYTFLLNQTGWEKTREQLVYHATNLTGKVMFQNSVGFDGTVDIVNALTEFTSYEKKFSDFIWFRLRGDIGKNAHIDFLKTWTNIESNFTYDNVPRKYFCYAILFGLTGHATALIRDKNSSQWFFYNDMDSAAYGQPWTDVKVYNSVLNLHFGGKQIVSFFYKGVIIDQNSSTLRGKLTALKTNLEKLKTNLATLAKKLSDLKSRIKKP